MRRIPRYLLLLCIFLCSISIASAQSSFDINIGFGAAQAKASNTQLNQALLPCAGPNDINGPCVSTSSLSGFMLGFGGDLMLWKSFGVSAGVSLQPAQQTYADLNASAALAGVSTLKLNSRLTLYDFDGIWQPINQKRVALKLRGGIGGANLKFYEAGSSSTAIIGSQNFSQYFGSSNHFAVNGGVGVQIYLTDHIFVRPEFKIYWVNNLTQQYGTNLVKEELVWVGYSWGGNR